MFMKYSLVFALTLLAPFLLKAAERPNIVFFIVDDQKRDFYTFLPDNEHPDVKGSVTPTLDRLAEEGIVLSELHVPSPVCVPSRFTALTGSYAGRAINDELLRRSQNFGYPAIGQNTRVTPETATLPRRLQSAGYRTGAVGKNHVIDVPNYRRARFDADITDPAIIEQLKKNTQAEKAGWMAVGFDFAERLYHDNVRANGPRVLNPHNLDWLTEGALQFIEESTKEEAPFYLYFAASTPHGPFGHWESGNRRATPDGMLEEAPNVLPSKASIAQRLRQAGYKKGDRHWEVAGDNMWTDDALAAIIKKLEALGEWDNTILIYFNDHGIESGKTTIYQGGMRSIAVIDGSASYIKGGRLNTSLTSSVDFGTTILNWAQYRGDREGIDGVDLAPLLEGKVESVRESVYGEIGITRAVRKGNWKYLALREPDYLKNMPLEMRQARIDKMRKRMKRIGREPFKNKATDPFAHIAHLPGGWDNTWSAMREHPAYFDADQLYNLAEDPHEKVNLAGDPEYAEILAEMKAELSKYLENMPGQFGEF